MMLLSHIEDSIIVRRGQRDVQTIDLWLKQWRLEVLYFSDIKYTISSLKTPLLAQRIMLHARLASARMLYVPFKSPARMSYVPLKSPVRMSYVPFKSP